MSFDLSTTNILLAVGVVALFITFIFVLMKLKPTTENKQDQEYGTNSEEEKTQLLQIPQPQGALPPPIKPVKSSIGNKPPALVVQAPETSPIVNQAEPSVLVLPHIENREIPNQDRTPAPPAEPELMPTREDCIHFYGYLHSLPKSTPIPDECFGCEKIVDCLISPNSTSSKTDGNHNSKKRGWL